MYDKCKQVLWTYNTLQFWATWVLFGGLIFLSFWAAQDPKRQEAMEMIPFFIGIIVVLQGFHFGTTLKKQFADPRARLMPGFTRPHVIVFASFTVLAIAVCPTILALIGGLYIGGAITMATIIFALMAWMLSGVSQHLAYTVFFTLIFGVSWFPPVAGKCAQILFNPENILLDMGLTGMAFTTLVVLLYRIAGLHEEAHGYHQNVPTNAFDTTSRQARLERKHMWDKTPTGFSGLMTRLIQRKAEVHPAWRYADADGWTRDRLWSIGLSQFSPWFMLMPVFLTAIVLVVMYLGSWFGPDTGAGSLFVFMPWLMICPMTLSMEGMTLMQKWGLLSTELLRPVRRGEMMREMFRALMMEAGIAWLATMLLCGAGVAVTSPAHITLSSAVTITLLATGMFMFCLSASIWVALLRVYLLNAVVLMVTIMPSFGIIGWWMAERKKYGDWPFMLAGAGMIAVGLVVIKLAHRSWCRAELGRN